MQNFELNVYIPSLFLNTVLDVVVDDVATVEIDVVIVVFVVVVVEDLVSSLSLMG